MTGYVGPIETLTLMKCIRMLINSSASSREMQNLC